MPARAQVMSIAFGEIGTREEPWGSNTGKRVRQYQAATWLGGSYWPWCVAFCVWTWKRAGLKVPYPSAGVYDLLRWARNEGWTTNHPQPGDLVAFQIGAGHIGIFEFFDRNGYVHTVDGNASDQVKRCSRPRSQVGGYITHPTFRQLAVKPKPKPKREPLWQVTTSVNGHRKVHARWAQSNVGKLLPKLLRAKAIDGITITRSKWKPTP